MISDSCKKVWSVVLSVLCFMVCFTQAQSVEAVTSSSQTSATTLQTKQNLSTSSQTIASSDPDTPYPWCVEQLFRISGYYSPKPDQKVYTRDTYEQEIKLNGRGVHGASGVPVFNGMVAAPKSYAFGTVIVLPGLGIGQVQDRWWAIVNSDWYDRIDVWVGEWDDGIHRAKSIGLRWMVWRYCPWSATNAIGFNWDSIPQYADFVSVAFWSIDQNIGRSGPLVSKAQSYLRSVGYLTTDTLPWVYDQQMRELVCRFQIDQLWLDGSEDYCGVLGPQTRTTLKKLLVKKWIISDTTLYTLTNSASISSLFTQSNTRPARNYQVNESTTTQSSWVLQDPIVTIDFSAIKASFTSDLTVGESSTRVVVLQKILAREKLFDHKITWYFGPVTKDALIKFQLKYKLIDTISHPAAGHIWPSTSKLLAKRQNLLRFASPKK